MHDVLYEFIFYYSFLMSERDIIQGNFRTYFPCKSLIIRTGIMHMHTAYHDRKLQEDKHRLDSLNCNYPSAHARDHL